MVKGKEMNWDLDAVIKVLNEEYIWDVNTGTITPSIKEALVRDTIKAIKKLNRIK